MEGPRAKPVGLHSVPLPACRQAGTPPSRAGLAGHLPVKSVVTRRTYGKCGQEKKKEDAET